MKKQFGVLMTLPLLLSANLAQANDDYHRSSHGFEESLYGRSRKPLVDPSTSNRSPDTDSTDISRALSLRSTGPQASDSTMLRRGGYFEIVSFALEDLKKLAQESKTEFLPSTTKISATGGLGLSANSISIYRGIQTSDFSSVFSLIASLEKSFGAAAEFKEIKNSLDAVKKSITALLNDQILVDDTYSKSNEKSVAHFTTAVDVIQSQLRALSAQFSANKKLKTFTLSSRRNPSGQIELNLITDIAKSQYIITPDGAYKPVRALKGVESVSGLNSILGATSRPSNSLAEIKDLLTGNEEKLSGTTSTTGDSSLNARISNSNQQGATSSLATMSPSGDYSNLARFLISRLNEKAQSAKSLQELAFELAMTSKRLVTLRNLAEANSEGSLFAEAQSLIEEIELARRLTPAVSIFTAKKHIEQTIPLLNETINKASRDRSATRNLVSSIFSEIKLLPLANGDQLIATDRKGQEYLVRTDGSRLSKSQTNDPERQAKIEQALNSQRQSEIARNNQGLARIKALTSGMGDEQLASLPNRLLQQTLIQEAIRLNLSGSCKTVLK